MISTIINMMIFQMSGGSFDMKLVDSIYIIAQKINFLIK
jgi:hypothetical protein